MMKQLMKVPVIVENLLVREIGDEIVILSQETNVIHQLELTSAFIWKLIDGKRRISDIMQSLCNEYEVAENIVQNDLFEFLNDCLQKKLIYYNKEDDDE